MRERLRASGGGRHRIGGSGTVAMMPEARRGGILRGPCCGASRRAWLPVPWRRSSCSVCRPRRSRPAPRPCPPSPARWCFPVPPRFTPPRATSTMTEPVSWFGLSAARRPTARYRSKRGSRAAAAGRWPARRSSCAAARRSRRRSPTAPRRAPAAHRSWSASRHGSSAGTTAAEIGS